MKKIIDILIEIFSPIFLKAIIHLSNAINSVFKYLQMKTEINEKTIKREALEKAENKIDKACDSGSIEDLIEAADQLGKEKHK